MAAGNYRDKERHMHCQGKDLTEEGMQGTYTDKDSRLLFVIILL